jgi:hypothetical protein
MHFDVEWKRFNSPLVFTHLPLLQKLHSNPTFFHSISCLDITILSLHRHTSDPHMKQRGNNLSHLSSDLLVLAQDILIYNLSDADANNLIHLVKDSSYDLFNTILATRFDINQKLA